MQKKVGIVKQLRRRWYRIQGEQDLITTFWPNDYQRGATYRVNGREFVITRYVRAADFRYFEVWGRAKDAGLRFSTREIASLDISHM